ncbi:MAG: thermonuclease family protein [Hyphomonadaceae bacterium]
MAKSIRLRAPLAVFAIVLALGAAILFATDYQTSRAEAQTPQLASAETPRALRGSSSVAQRMRVIDGDTMEDTREDITYRLVNIDTPETGSRARCAAERDLGNRATAAARALVSEARRVEFRPTGRIDRYGRTIAFVVIDGRDMGETLMAEGLARPWRGRREPWCDASGNLIP